MHYWESVTCPCDLATILSRVDNRVYSTLAAYLADVALIAQVGTWEGRGLGVW